MSTENENYSIHAAAPVTDTQFHANVTSSDDTPGTVSGEEAQAAMNFSISDAEELSPKRIQNRIVRDVDNLSRSGAYLMNEAFPLYQMGDYEEVYHRLRGLRAPMPGSTLVSESPIAGLEGLSEDEMNVTPLKQKISPEKAVSAVLNANADIMDIANVVSMALRTDLLTSRSLMAWRGYNGVPGMIGEDGLTAHPKLSGSHVLTGSDFSDTANSQPHDVFSNAVERISKDGKRSGDVGPVTAYVPTNVFWDLMRNDSLESRLPTDSTQTVNGANELETALSIDRVVEIRTKVPRTNDQGEPIAEDPDPSDSTPPPVVPVDEAEEDNILEPWDTSSATANRNIVVGAFGRDSGVMPWLVERLADHIGAAPMGDFALNMQEGFLMQGWTQPDPVISWRKMAQEIGLELIRPDNYVVIQDV